MRPFNRYVINKNGSRRPKAQTVSLNQSNSYKTVTVHFLVLTHFYNGVKNGLTIDHKDRNPFNNNIDNLRWANKLIQTRNKKEFRKDRIKITMADLDKICNRMKKEFMVDIAKEYGMSKSDLSKLLIYMHPTY